MNKITIKIDEEIYPKCLGWVESPSRRYVWDEFYNDLYNSFDISNLDIDIDINEEWYKNYIYDFQDSLLSELKYYDLFKCKINKKLSNETELYVDLEFTFEEFLERFITIDNPLDYLPSDYNDIKEAVLGSILSRYSEDNGDSHFYENLPFIGFSRDSVDNYDEIMNLINSKE